MTSPEDPDGIVIVGFDIWGPEWEEPQRLKQYELRVQAMAAALHEDCRLEWQAIAHVDPGRQITQHLTDAHYGRAHDLVRRLTDKVEFEPTYREALQMRAELNEEES